MRFRPPGDVTRVFFHSCCAPCASGILLRLLDNGIVPTVIFFNPNIHPYEEYVKRKEAQAGFLDRQGIAFIDADYRPEAWLADVSGLEHERERGRRCAACFLHRLQYSARFAHDHGFQVLTSSFGISRWKDQDQVARAGHEAVRPFEGLVYWDQDWRADGGQDWMRIVTQRERFYQQTYCGCQFSLRQKNF